MHLIPNDAVANDMLAAIGVGSVDDLFADIPRALRAGGLDLPVGEPERQLVSRLKSLLDNNQSYYRMANFLGGGLKPHHVPAAVKAVAHRQEFITSYTPYQPEVSQGLLQALFEYQSLMADVTAMDVVNSSMYDWSTALGEAALMATRVNRRPRLLVPANLLWEKQSVLANYTRGAGIQIEAYRYDPVTGRTDLEDLRERLGPDVAGVYVENPNLFGVFEQDAAKISDMAHEAGALSIMGVDPTSLGVVTPPGKLGADIVVGEASCFGGAPALGGPLLGLFATTEKLVRKMPGRLIGATHDAEGRRGFVMTLQAREQHIRRDKATSNICSNEALLSVQAAIHLSMLGRRGLRDLGLQNLAAGERLEKTLEAAGLKKAFKGEVYNELVTEVGNVDDLHTHALGKGVHIGLQLRRAVPAEAGLVDGVLWGATEFHDDRHFQQLADMLASVPRAEVVA